MDFVVRFEAGFYYAQRGWMQLLFVVASRMIRCRYINQEFLLVAEMRSELK